MNDKREDCEGPIFLHAEGWERLPDGRRQLLIRCKSAEDYRALPKKIKLGKIEWRRFGFDSERRIACYRTDAERNLPGN